MLTIFTFIGVKIIKVLPSFILITLASILYTSIYAQKNISYKYELERRYNTYFNHRIVSARKAVYTKNISTVFFFDSTINVIKIANKTYNITSTSNCDYFLTGNWTKVTVVNLYDKENDVELIFQVDETYYRYYFKRSTWVNPFGCTW